MKGRRWRRKRRRRKRRRRGKTGKEAVCRAGPLWITWSSAGLCIYSSTAAVRGSGASCMFLPRTTAKQGRGGSICWILDSAALEPNTLQFPSARALTRLRLGNVECLHLSMKLRLDVPQRCCQSCVPVPCGTFQSSKRSADRKDFCPTKPRPSSRRPCNDITGRWDRFPVTSQRSEVLRQGESGSVLAERGSLKA